MADIMQNVQKVKDSLSNYPNVTIVAATKYVDANVAKELVHAFC